MKEQKVLLAILDGWGIAQHPEVSAIEQAQPAYFQQLMRRYPNARLTASGPAVGLPEGQMGNSEVGHINIGAGRIVYQELQRISNAIADGTLARSAVFQELIAYCKQHLAPLHLMGLVSDGGVHSSIHHLIGIIETLAPYRLPEVYIHCFTDGRDTDPHSGIRYIEQLQQVLNRTGTGRIVTVTGRYYAMDRDKRWERTQLAYQLLTEGKGQWAPDATTALKQSYGAGISDEFILPTYISSGLDTPAVIAPGDAVLNINFRTDRNRQISFVLTQADLPEYDMYHLPIHYVTMNRYDATYRDVSVLFERDTIINPMGAVLEAHGKTQVRIAETEKYPHVTFFFNGGREEPFVGEKRILVPSPKVATYDLCPEMSAREISKAIIAEMETNGPDFICLNFANPDMVGHTGNMEATKQAILTVDACLEQVVEAALALDYALLIISDHGNADYMMNPDGSPNTAHSLAQVPCILVSNQAHWYDLHNGVLGDVAPTILNLMGIEQPAEMTGRPLTAMQQVPSLA
jgi:2,3-bisphosphoglycerate-independent phosphoglycerate mutase